MLHPRIVHVAIVLALGLAAPIHAAVTVQITAPAAGALVGNDVPIVATVSSGFEIRSVKASVAGRVLDLTFSTCAIPQPCRPGWIGTLSMAGLARGHYVIVVEARDAAGDSQAASVGVSYDLKPGIQVRAPIGTAIARPTLRVTAWCTDDDACVSIGVILGGAVLAAGTDRIDQDVSLAAAEGTQVQIYVEGTDTAGQKSAVPVIVIVESSPRLAEVTSIPGRWLDVRGDRLLFAVPRNDGEGVWIRDRATGRDTLIAIYPADTLPRAGRLTSVGALVDARGPSGGIVEWRDGVLSGLASFPSSDARCAMSVAGDYALWCARRYHIPSRAIETLPVPNTCGFASPCIQQGVVAEDGRAVFEFHDSYAYPDPWIHWFDGGSTRLLRSFSGYPTAGPVTTGTTVLVVHEGTAYLWDNGALQPTWLVTPQAGISGTRDRLYQAAGTWLAFVRASQTGQWQVWRRAADGTETQVTAFADTSLLDTLAPNGDLTYTRGGRRYLARIGQPALDVSSAQGRAWFVDGRWYVTLAGTLFMLVDPGTTDADSDGLPDDWERRVGLDPALANAAQDPDGDGRTNQQEFAAGTHPRGFFTRYFAEGATLNFFDLQIALLNPGTTMARTLLRFLKPDQTTSSLWLDVQGRSRQTVIAKTVSGLESAAFSSVIESDVELVADRTMTWDASGYGSHAETAIVAPATTWYLAEGATHSNFSLFYLVQNPNSTAAQVLVTYLLPAGTPLTKTYTVPANSRFNIWVNAEANQPGLSALASSDVSAKLTADQPIIVERAMYLSRAGQVFGAGHESAGITTPATSWFLAEGATGSYFDEFVLIANPNATAAQIQARFLLPTGAVITKTYTVGANSRFNIWVDQADPALADAAVSTTITSTNGVPVIVERAMWWPGPTASTWIEAHNTPGSTVTGTKWALAEGEEGGARSVQTYVLIANTSATAGTAKVTAIFEDGATTEQIVALAANSRTNVTIPGAAGRRFGVIVESVGSTPAQIVVERAMYSNANGVVWAAGTSALATKLQ